MHKRCLLLPLSLALLPIAVFAQVKGNDIPAPCDPLGSRVLGLMKNPPNPDWQKALSSPLSQIESRGLIAYIRDNGGITGLTASTRADLANLQGSAGAKDIYGISLNQTFIDLLDCMSHQPGEKDGTAAITPGLPDLRGPWHSRSTVVANYEIIQSGNHLTAQLLQAGQPPYTVFDGIFQNRAVLVGTQRIPGMAPFQEMVTVADQDDLMFNSGLILLRTSAYPPAPSEKSSAAAKPIPEAKGRGRTVDLNGAWEATTKTVGTPEFATNYVLIEQNDLTTIGVWVDTPAIFRAFTTNSGTIPDVFLVKDRNQPRKTAATLMIDDPDHIRLTSAVTISLHRLVAQTDKPLSRLHWRLVDQTDKSLSRLHWITFPRFTDDVSCDFINRFHVSGDGSYARGYAEEAAGQYHTAACWYGMSAMEGNPDGEQKLGNLLHETRSDDPAILNLELALFTKSAAQNNYFGLRYLALMYSWGTVGKADYSKGKELDKRADAQRTRLLDEEETAGHMRHFFQGIAMLMDFGPPDESHFWERLMQEFKIEPADIIIGSLPAPKK